MRVDVERYVAGVLGVGVVLSLIVLVLGSLLYIMNPAPAGPPGSIVDILRGAARLDPIATINLGLLILLITPAARVVAALIAFALQRDGKYVLISLAVLCVLVISAVAGSGD